MNFRDLTRKKKQLPEEDCVALLQKEKRGVLSVLGDGGYPYGTPLDHYYDADENTLYFHCGRVGHRLDALKSCDKASYCCVEAGEPIEGDWALRVRSVIAFGRVEVIDDYDKVVDITTKLSRRFTDDEDYIRDEIRRFARATLLLALHIEHLCGKVVEEK